MSPQRSNRVNLLEGTLRCLSRLPMDRVTARVIAQESGANVASITYHFGSKDNLVTEAVVLGLDRWLADIAADLRGLESEPPPARVRRAAEVFEAGRAQHTGLARTFVAALAKAQHDDRVRELLAAGFRRSRADVAAVLGIGSDQPGEDAAGLVQAMFDGLLFQVLLDPGLAIDGDRMTQALARLREALPGD